MKRIIFFLIALIVFINIIPQTYYGQAQSKATILRTEYEYSLDHMAGIQVNRSPRTDEYGKKIAYVSSEYIDIDRGGNIGTVNTTETNLNVRFEPNTKSSVVGSLAPDTIVEVLGSEIDTVPGVDRTWHVIEHDHKSPEGRWQFARYNDVKRMIDPNSFTLDINHSDMYQFLLLSESSGVSAAYLNNELDGKGKMSGTGPAFVDAGREYEINEFYLLSHAILETGHGRSALSSGVIKVGQVSDNKWASIQENGTFIAELIGNKWVIEELEEPEEEPVLLDTDIEELDKKEVVQDNEIEDPVKEEIEIYNIKDTYNMFGIGAVDQAPDTLGSIRAYREGWDTPEKAIRGGVKFIAEKYVHSEYEQDTLYKMRWNPDYPGTHQYATDIGWAKKQVSNIYKYYQALPDLNKSFDIPKYLSDPSDDENEPSEPIDELLVERLNGNTRYTTSVEISKNTYAKADTVILASGEDGNFPDALAGAPLAAKLKAPILLTEKDEVRNGVMAEIERLGASKIILLGGKLVISEKVVEQLKNNDLTVERISGGYRHNTAIAIGEELQSNSKTAVLVNGFNFPDGLAIGSAAASKGYPILFTDVDEIADATLETLEKWEIEEVLIIGGELAISNDIEKQLKADYEVERISGGYRYTTALRIAEKFFEFPDTVILASGKDFPDALAGGPLASNLNAPILLTEKDKIREDVLTYIEKSSISKVFVLGGELAISERVINQIKEN